MFKKKIFSESFFIKEKINNPSFIDLNIIKNHILLNNNVENFYNDNQYWHLNQYIKIPFSQHISWLQDYLRDHYGLMYFDTLCPSNVDSIRAIIQKPNDVVFSHNNIKDYDLINSPDIDCIYTVNSVNKVSYLIFEYDDGRNKHRKWKIPLEKNYFVLFPSHLNRYITKNENESDLINLSLHFNILKD